MVNNYYNKIAWDYHLKRKKPWKALEDFFNCLKEKKYNFPGYCIDLGCGSGRNFTIFKESDNKLIGIDNSIEFLKIAKSNLNDVNQYSKFDADNIQLILGDINYSPIKAKAVNNVFSIASIHHIKGKEERQEVILKLHDLMKENAFLLLTVWRRWQKKFKKYFIIDKLKRLFNPKYKIHQKKLDLSEFGDKHVPWTISKKDRTYNRFYHFFTKKEMKNVLKTYKIREFKKSGGPTNKDNFFILAQK